MRFLCAFLGAAIFMGTMHGCDGGGDLKEGVSKDTSAAAPGAMPGMDDMKAKMDKKKK